MVGQGDSFEDGTIGEAVVLSEHVEHGLFVAQQSIERKVVVDEV